MKIKENERIYSALLENQCEWDSFHSVADLIETKLKIQFNKKVDDLILNIGILHF